MILETTSSEEDEELFIFYEWLENYLLFEVLLIFYYFYENFPF